MACCLTAPSHHLNQWSIHYLHFVFTSDSYENPEIALDSGAILRECCKYEPLAKIILKSDEFFKFFDYVELPTADVASDAFLSFEVCRHDGYLFTRVIYFMLDYWGIKNMKYVYALVAQRSIGISHQYFCHIHFYDIHYEYLDKSLWV